MQGNKGFLTKNYMGLALPFGIRTIFRNVTPTELKDDRMENRINGSRYRHILR